MSKLPALASLGSTLPSVKLPTAMNVIYRVANGETVRKACADCGTTTLAFRHALTLEPELEKLFKEAVEAGNDEMADMLVNINEIEADPRFARIVSDNMKWLLERRKPDKYGQRVQVSMDNNATKALLAALDLAIGRVPSATMPQISDRAHVVDVDVEYVDNKNRAAPLPEPPLVYVPREDAARPLNELEELRRLGMA